MKKLALLAILFSTAAYADDPPTPAPTPTPAAPSAPAPHPAPPPVQPTSWNVDGLDQQDLATINQCIGELKYKDAAPFVAKFNAKLKPIK